MSSSRVLQLCLSLGLGAAGCSHSGDENLGLSTRAPSYTVDVAQLTQPAMLERALGLPGRELDGKLGPHRLEATATLKVESPGKPVETLEESWRLDTDGKGALHLVHENNRSSGMEAIVTGGELYVRPRFGKFVERRPEGDEVDRLRAAVEGVAADYFSLLERAVQLRDDGRAQVAGHAAFKLKLSALPTASPAQPESDPARKWRETVNVRYADGDLALDAASGALLAARLEASYTFQRDGVKAPFATTLVYKMSTAAPEAIAAPADAAPSPHRTRPMLDRQELLEGLKP